MLLFASLPGVFGGIKSVMCWVLGSRTQVGKNWFTRLLEIYVKYAVYQLVTREMDSMISAERSMTNE